MTPQTGIPEQQMQQILEMLAQYPAIDQAIVFGSRAKGNFREGSDIDLALKGNGLTSRMLTQIEMDYDRLYLPWELNLIVYEHIDNEALQAHIDRVGIALVDHGKRP